MTDKPSLSELDARDENDPIVNWDDKKTGPTLTYAWNWFSYHANQRLTAFNYFLIIVGVLTTGYITSLEKRLTIVQVIIGFVGVLISLAFLALDIRNEQLVNDGRNALRKLERALGMKTGIHRADYDRKRNITISHAFWLRFIERMALILFFFALIFGLYNSYRYGLGGAPLDSSGKVSTGDR